MEYQHGGDIYSQDIQMDYSANINPLGMPEAVSQALRDCLEREVCSLYPDSRCERLRQALGRHHGVEDKWIICGNGAADLIFGLAAALRPVRGLVTAPAFSEYEQALRSVGCRTDYYYLREDGDFALDAAGMCGCVQEAAERGRPYDVVFLCNPNNPTGIPVKKEEVEQLADTCERLGAYLAVMNASAIFWIIQNHTPSYLTWPGLRICLSLRHLQSCMPWPGCGWATAFAATGAFWNGFRQYASPGPCPARPSVPAWRPLERRILRSAPERCLKGSGRGFLPPSMTWAFRYIHPRPIICSFGTGKRMVSWKKAGFTRSCWAGAS